MCVYVGGCWGRKGRIRREKTGREGIKGEI